MTTLTQYERATDRTDALEDAARRVREALRTTGGRTVPIYDPEDDELHAVHFEEVDHG